MSTTTFTVTAITGAYVVNGINDPQLTMYRGQTYTFNINASGHPFYIQTTTPFNSGDIYSNGVTNNGIQNGTLTFVVPLDAPSSLYYVCQIHSNMGNQINITDDPIPCYSKGTLILTNQGYIKVEDIKKGDIVVRGGRISSNGILEKNIDVNEAPIVWIGKFTVKILNSNSRPICITKNAFGEECPFVDLYVSPAHRLLINDKTVESSNLVNGETIYQDNECKSVEYYHLECDVHSAIYANGVLAETYQEWHREVFDVDN
jgi:hypothetical protein